MQNLTTSFWTIFFVIMCIWGNGKKTHALCKICHVNETSKHLIFECENVVQIWYVLSLYLKIDTKWKHAIIEFFHEHNRKVISLETLISYVAYSIFKYKMYCRLSSFDETNYNILCNVKSSIVFYSFILKKLNSDTDYKLFQNS